jgi:hypothetical protein
MDDRARGRAGRRDGRAGAPMQGLAGSRESGRPSPPRRARRKPAVAGAGWWAGHMLPRQRDPLLAVPPARPVASARAVIHYSTACRALRGRNVDNCNSCPHARAGRGDRWPGTTGRQAGRQAGGIAALLDCAALPRWSSLERDRWITLVGLTEPAGDRSGGRRGLLARGAVEHTVGTGSGWELAVRPEK